MKKHSRRPPRLLCGPKRFAVLIAFLIPLAVVRATDAFDSDGLAYHLMLRVDEAFGAGASQTFLAYYGWTLYLNWPEWMGGRSSWIPGITFDISIFLVVACCLWFSGRRIRIASLALLGLWSVTNLLWLSLLWRSDYLGLWERSYLDDLIAVALDGVFIFIPAVLLVSVTARSVRVLWWALAIAGLGVTLAVLFKAHVQHARAAGSDPLPFTIVSGAWQLTLVVALVIDTLRTRRDIARKLSLNHCSVCGYDLTGIDRDTKCPECGAEPAIRSI